MVKRSFQLSAAFILVLAAAYSFWEIYQYSQARYFSIDEYQYGHATWLVARGAKPYVDFFEHHFPLSYVIHAPFYWLEWDYAAGARLLRQITVSYLLVVSLLASACCWGVTRNPYAALLTLVLPAGLGFGLMTSIEYRADNFGFYYFAACLVILEWNRRKRSRAIAVVCGLLAALAALMTQKMAFIAGGTLAAMLVCDLAPRIGFVRAKGWLARRREEAAYIADPIAFFSTAVGLGLVCIAIGGAVGAVGGAGIP